MTNNPITEIIDNKSEINTERYTFGYMTYLTNQRYEKIFWAPKNYPDAAKDYNDWKEALIKEHHLPQPTNEKMEPMKWDSGDERREQVLNSVITSQLLNITAMNL